MSANISPMPERLIPLLDGLSILVMAIITTAGGAMLTVDADAPGAGSDELRLLLMPLIGAVLASFVMLMFYMEQSSRKENLGRFVAACFFGSSIPVALGSVWSWAANLVHHPVALMLTGSLTSILVFLLIKAITDKILERRDRIAEMAVDEAERRLPRGMQQKRKNRP